MACGARRGQSAGGASGNPEIGAALSAGRAECCADSNGSAGCGALRCLQTRRSDAVWRCRASGPHARWIARRGRGACFILWALAEELRALWRIKQGLAAGRPLTALTREARVWGAREKLIGPAAQRVSMAALHAALTFAARLDRQLKGLPQPFRGEPRGAMPQMDPWRGLFELAMRISAPEKSMKNTNERIFQRDCSSASASLRSARR